MTSKLPRLTEAEYHNLQQAVETGRWGNGQRLTKNNKKNHYNFADL